MVYLIHFEQKLSHSQHYIGYALDEKFSARIHHHEKGTGAAILKALNQKGIKWSVVRQWPDKDGNFERALKEKKKARLLCPVCNPSGFEKVGVNVKRKAT